MSKCFICPRMCGARRDEGERGRCGCGEEMLVSKVMLHRGEEPVIDGDRGAIAVFFGGCSLGCKYCQNAEISLTPSGRTMSTDELAEEIEKLAACGASTVEFVTAAHFVLKLAKMLERLKPRLGLPIVYNSGGYERAKTLAALDGLVDVYLPDYKYADRELAEKYSSAPDYPEVAEAAIAEMLRQRPRAVVKDGVMREGVLIRHLVLPGCRANGIAVMRRIKERFGGAAVSIMRQYTPEFNRSGFKELDRRVTTFEYESVVAEAVRLGLNGFRQEKGCETSEMTPDFVSAAEKSRDGM